MLIVAVDDVILDVCGYWYAEFNLFGKDKEINSLGFFPWCFIKWVGIDVGGGMVLDVDGAHFGIKIDKIEFLEQWVLWLTQIFYILDFISQKFIFYLKFH